MLTSPFSQVSSRVEGSKLKSAAQCKSDQEAAEQAAQELARLHADMKKKRQQAQVRQNEQGLELCFCLPSSGSRDLTMRCLPWPIRVWLCAGRSALSKSRPQHQHKRVGWLPANRFPTLPAAHVS